MNGTSKSHCTKLASWSEEGKKEVSSNNVTLVDMNLLVSMETKVSWKNTFDNIVLGFPLMKFLDQSGFDPKHDQNLSAWNEGS